MAKILILALFLFNCVALAEDGPLRVPLKSSKISLDPSHVEDSSSLLVSRQINCQLVRNQGGIYIFEAAKSIKYTSPLEIVITLNDNAKFTDGTPVAANDVVASFNYIKNSRTVLRNVFRWVKNIRSTDKKTVIVKLERPIPQFLSALSAPIYAIFKESFLKRASQDKALWAQPIGCGGYKIQTHTSHYYYLTSLRGELSIKFYLNAKNQLTANELQDYDLSPLTLADNTYPVEGFYKINALDPTQKYIGLNTSLPPWNIKENRCAFLAKLDPSKILTVYGKEAVLANDFLPQSTLGYDANESFFSTIINHYKNTRLPLKHSFCVSFLRVSIPEEYDHTYIEMIKAIYPKIRVNQILDSKSYGPTFLKQKCDAFVFGLKSNYLDGYEYINLLANKDANFTGYLNNKLSNEIEGSQNITNAKIRSKTYRAIINQIENECLIRPLVTVPMENIYIRKGLDAPGIGLVPFNEYYLGNVKRV